jgi:hypothetical protein
MFLEHPYIIKVRRKNEEEEQTKNVQQKDKKKTEVTQLPEIKQPAWLLQAYLQAHGIYAAK